MTKEFRKKIQMLQRVIDDYKKHTNPLTPGFSENTIKTFIKDSYTSGRCDIPLIFVFDSPLQCYNSILFFGGQNTPATEKLLPKIKEQAYVQLQTKKRTKMDGVFESKIWNQTSKHSVLKQNHSSINYLGNELVEKQTNELLRRGKKLKNTERILEYIAQSNDDTNLTIPFLRGILSFSNSVPSRSKVIFYNFLLRHHNVHNRFFMFKRFCYASYEGIVVMSRPPVSISVDDNTRLNNTDGPAVLYRDNYKQFFVNGVEFPERLFNSGIKNKELSGRKIMMIGNTEQKAVLIKHYGYEQILKSLDEYKVIDTVSGVSKVTGEPLKYEVIEFKIGDSGWRSVICRVVKVMDATDGRITVLGVPVNKMTETCNGAIKWTFGLNENEEYNPTMES